MRRIDIIVFTASFVCILGLIAFFAWGQGPSDRDMILVEPSTTVSGLPITNLLNCVVEITDASGLLDSRTIDASSPTGGDSHNIDLTGKVGHTIVEAFCHNTLIEASTRAQLARTFPGDVPSPPVLQE